MVICGYVPIEKKMNNKEKIEEMKNLLIDYMEVRSQIDHDFLSQDVDKFLDTNFPDWKDRAKLRKLLTDKKFSNEETDFLRKHGLKV